MRHNKKDQTCSALSSGPAQYHEDERRLRRLDAFAPPVREAVCQLASAGSRLEELAESFPALLFALATGYGTSAKRRQTIEAVLAGRPLRDAASQLGLPFWLRKLPPQALLRPLSNLPDDPAVTNRLASLVPLQPSAMGPWLERVSLAHLSGRADITVWTAQQYRGTTPQPVSDGFLRTQAWCWFAGQPGLRGEQLLASRWKPGIGARRAAQESALWLQRIELDACLGRGLRDSWLAEGSVQGFDFVALRNADDFIAEALAMDNCLDRYADRLTNRAVRIFSIRRDGRSVADVEISGHDRELGMPAVAQLRAARNRRATLEVWQATYAWLGSQPVRPVEPSLTVKAPPSRRRKRLVAIWQPYLDLLPVDVRRAFEEAMLPTTARRGEGPRRGRATRRGAPAES